MSSFEMRFDLSGLKTAIGGIERKLEAAIRPAAQAGAQVLVDAVQSNLSRIGQKTGNLAGSIYQVYSRDNSDKYKVTYHISWNTKKAPHGHLLEFGYMQRWRVVMLPDGTFFTDKKHPLASPKQIAARPFVRPAASKLPLAVAAAQAKLAEVLGNDV